LLDKLFSVLKSPLTRPRKLIRERYKPLKSWS